ncbi:MAG: hypothetical protein U1E65_04690 [Myxococcota bacterium]
MRASITKSALLPLLLALPRLASACPVCGQAPEQSRAAYLLMTAVMTFLPLTVLGVLFYAAFRRFRRAAEEQALSHPRAIPTPPRTIAESAQDAVDPGRQTSEAFEA